MKGLWAEALGQFKIYMCDKNKNTGKIIVSDIHSINVYMIAG